MGQPPTCSDEGTTRFLGSVFPQATVQAKGRGFAVSSVPVCRALRLVVKELKCLRPDSPVLVSVVSVEEIKVGRCLSRKRAYFYSLLIEEQGKLIKEQTHEST